MQTENFDIEAFTDKHRAALWDEILAVAGSAEKFIRFGVDDRARLIVKRLAAPDDEPWRRLSRLTLGLLAAAVSQDLGRSIAPRHLQRLLEHAVVLMATPEPQFQKMLEDSIRAKI